MEKYSYKNIAKKILVFCTRPFEYAKSYGIWYGISLFYIEIMLKFNPNKINEFKRHKIIEDYIKQKGYVDTMINAYYSSEPDKIYNPHNAPIWVCWLQGLDNMPPITKVCLQKIRQFSGNHPVIFLDMHNYNKYVDMDARVVGKYIQGNMKPAHFADVLRLKLLNKWGGVWIDSTVFLTKELDERLFTQPFVTIKNDREENNYTISFFRWCSFFIGCGSDRRIISALCAGLEEYAITENQFMHYLIIDYLLDILCKEIKDVDDYINKLPLTNPNMHKLRKKFNEVFDEDEYKELIRNTSVFKLVYSPKPDEYLLGKPTYYSYLLHSTDNKYSK